MNSPTNSPSNPALLHQLQEHVALGERLTTQQSIAPGVARRYAMRLRYLGIQLLGTSSEHLGQLRSEPPLPTADNAMAFVKAQLEFALHASKCWRQSFYPDPVKEARVFIGHGRAPAWLELRYFLEDRLELRCDEFNREPAAGFSTIERLHQMLDNSAFAFLVMTAEDEHADASLVARQNVVHEIGLFQGRLGMRKAIVMLEDGCQQFSNIHGLIHIPFGKNRIAGAFEEVRRVLEREGLVATTGRNLR